MFYQSLIIINILCKTSLKLATTLIDYSHTKEFTYNTHLHTLTLIQILADWRLYPRGIWFFIISREPYTFKG